MSELQLSESESADFSEGEVYVIDDATTALLMPVNRNLPDVSRTAHALLVAELLNLLAGPGTPAVSPPTPQALRDPFTEGEIRILRYLPTHLTAREIAGQLHVSVHTVTTHMRHLYTKLGVHRRHEAVAQARALGLLSPSSHRLGYVPRYCAWPLPLWQPRANS
jgi:ATP/maltotriose-dependent transcriptional regulator MalT